MTKVLFSQPEVLNLGEELAGLSGETDHYQRDDRWVDIGLTACAALDTSGIEGEVRRAYADEAAANRYLTAISNVTNYSVKVTAQGDQIAEALWIEGDTEAQDAWLDDPDQDPPYLLIETRRDGVKLTSCRVFSGIPCPEFGGHDERMVLSTTPTISEVLVGGDEGLVASLQLSPEEHDAMQKLARTVRAARAIVGLEAQPLSAKVIC